MDLFTMGSLIGDGRDILDRIRCCFTEDQPSSSLLQLAQARHSSPES